MPRATELMHGFINFVIGLVEVLLGLRFILRLFGANPDAGFVSWLYETTRTLLEPFFGIFPSPQLEAGFVIEFSTLFAMIVYGLAAWLLLELTSYIGAATATAAAATTKNDTKKSGKRTKKKKK